MPVSLLKGGCGRDNSGVVGGKPKWQHRLEDMTRVLARKPAPIMAPMDNEPGDWGAILSGPLVRGLVSTAEEALQVASRAPMDLILAEYRAAGIAGLDLLARLTGDRGASGAGAGSAQA
jgi:hypothetical protein